jgi:pimeloyl-ACP methyl ester carboxylesterase
MAGPVATEVTDVIVVIPGIMGSALAKDGKKVWDSKPGFIIPELVRLGRDIKSLQLTEDVGDGKPNDGVEPVGLIYDLHVIPGTSKGITGYTSIVNWLKRELVLTQTSATDPAPGNLWLFAYDWRLSNRYNGERLAREAGMVLDRWQEHSRNPDARLILLCHSMGGLIARYFLEVKGGHALTRRLVTMGTPYRGSVDALGKLVNGADVRLGPLTLAFSDFVRSLPSLYELLPDYECIDDGAGLKNVSDAIPDPLNKDMVMHAAAFHQQIRNAIEHRIGPAPYTTHPVVGLKQPTLTTARSRAGVLELLNTYKGKDEGGDGTVPRLSARPGEVDSDSPIQTYCAERHGSLTAHIGVQEHLAGVITSVKKVYKDAPIGAEISVGLPELVLSDEPFRLDITSEVDDLLLVASLVNSKGNTVQSVTAQNLDGRSYRADFKAVPADLYAVRVGPPEMGPSVQVKPVTGHTLVWDRTALDGQA